MKTIRRLLSVDSFLLKTAMKSDSKSFMLYLLFTCVNSVIPLCSIWIWSKALDTLVDIYTNRAFENSILVYMGIYVLLQLFLAFSDSVGSVMFHRLNHSTTHRMDTAIMRKMADVDVSFFDDPANQDSLLAARESETYISGNVTTALHDIINFFALLLALAMLLSKNWIVGLVYICTYIPGGILSFHQKKKMDEYSIDKIPVEKEKEYYKHILTGEYFAKELRLYHLAGRFKRKYNDAWNALRRMRQGIFRRGALFSLIATLLTYLGFVFLIAFSVGSVVSGVMTIGALVMFINLSGVAGEKLNICLEGISFVSEFIGPKVERYQEFLRYENQIEYNIEYNHDVKAPSKPSIEFKNVFFKYPGADQYTIKDLTFRIDGGKKIALLGVNGSGKTTVVKLLLRLYEPESGQIKIGGRDIKAYSQESLYQIFGVCFQEVSKYALTLRENLALSDISRRQDKEALFAAAEASGADRIISELPHGLETDMTRNFNDEGAELSGGQWQKIALTRTFFRNADVVILDEPSSALDPVAEDHIFSSFKKLCKGKSGILISHRLSSVMTVDEILLLENGTVAEKGTHDELMAKNGRYAYLYRLQAEKYGGNG